MCCAKFLFNKDHYKWDERVFKAIILLHVKKKNEEIIPFGFNKTFNARYVNKGKFFG